MLRAEPSGFLDLVPPARLACVQTFRPLHDALVAEEPDRFQLWLARHEGDLVAAAAGLVDRAAVTAARDHAP